MTLVDWNDARLDDLHDEVKAVNRLGTEVSALTERVDGLRTDMHYRFDSLAARMDQRDKQEHKRREQDAERRRRRRNWILSAVGSLGSLATIVGLVITLVRF